MDRVCLVTQGEYSDYRVLHVFGSEEAAHAYVDGNADRDNPYGNAPTIDARPVLTMTPVYRTLHRRVARLVADDDGSVVVTETEDAEPVADADRPTDDPFPAVLHAYTAEGELLEAAVGRAKDGHSRLPPRRVVSVEGFDEARVAKAFRDRVAAVKARLAGVA